MKMYGYDHDAEREAAYCDRCGYYHSDQADCEQTVTKMNAATPQDSEMCIFGAGISSDYSWWHSFDQMWHNTEDPLEPPDDWTWAIVAENPEGGKAIRKEIQHRNVMAAARKIIGKKFNSRDDIKQECRNLLFDVDEANLDAAIADAVLQVAVYGDIIFS